MVALPVSPALSAPGEETGGVVVAAITYAGATAAQLGCESDHVCAVETLVRRAHARGARLIVAPEYALPQKKPEPDLVRGQQPPSRQEAPFQYRFANLAQTLAVYIVINLETAREGKVYNTLVAFDPDGRVAASHHKFELFEAERQALSPGDSVVAFDTPFGRVGLLTCADIYGPPGMHRELADKADIIAFSAQWTALGAPRWPAAFAHDWGVYVVAANGSTGEGRGGGVFDPRGESIAPPAQPDAPLHVANLLIAPKTRRAGSDVEQ
jgi:predicted amidohydrolase